MNTQMQHIQTHYYGAYRNSSLLPGIVYQSLERLETTNDFAPQGKWDCFYEDYELTHVQNSRGRMQSFNLVLDMLTSGVEIPQSTFYLSQKTLRFCLSI